MHRHTQTHTDTHRHTQYNHPIITYQTKKNSKFTKEIDYKQLNWVKSKFKKTRIHEDQ